MANESESPILLIAAKWQTRALLAAQVAETSGRDVVSAPAVNEALQLIKLGGVDPAVLVVDTGQQMDPDDVARLTEASRDTPLVLVVSRLRRERFQGLRPSCPAILVRPVSLGEIARTVVQVLKGGAN